MSRRPRPLSPDEVDLWRQVAKSARALRADRPVPLLPPPAAHVALPAPQAKPSLAAAFRVGEKVHHPPQRTDLAPGPRDHLAAQPVRMDRKTYERMARGKIMPEARIDLHGMTLSEAHSELVHFILSAHRAGMRLVLVITGKGKRGLDQGPIPARIGALRHQVPHWLALPPLGSHILQVTPSSVRHGGDGALYVYLRRR